MFNVPLRVVFKCMKHFRSVEKHGFAYVSERSVIFNEDVECDVCLKLLDEVDVESSFM